MVRIGVLSDTHLQKNSAAFLRAADEAFSMCDTIIHAGDVTEQALLQVFSTKQLFAVHGNMCSPATRRALPAHLHVSINGYRFGICHGAGPRMNIEERMIELFPDVDCIIYGHTHHPVCHRVGETLIMNPGSFQATGPYGALGTYGIISFDHKGVQGQIHTLKETYTF